MSSGASVMLNEVDVIEVKKNDPKHKRNSTMLTEVGQMVAGYISFVLL